MAYTFIANQGNGSTIKPAQASGVVATTYDAGTLGKMEELGANIQPTNISPQQLAAAATPAAFTVGGSTVSGFQDTVGNKYVIDENSTVLKVDQKTTPTVTGIPTQVDMGGPVLGGGMRPGPVDMNPPIVTRGGGGMLGSGKIFSAFENGDIIPNQQEEVTRALWSNNVGNLTTFFTSSAQTATQKRYYYEIYNSSSAACGSEAQFSVAYGHQQGSGSADEGGVQINDTPSRAIYSQMAQLCLEPTKRTFNIGGTAVNSIYSVVVNRARMREWLDEGNLEINLHHLSGSQWVAGGKNLNAYTGSNVKLGEAGRVLRLIDDSSITPASVGFSGEAYRIVSGSLENGVYNSSNPHVYGVMYRRLGIVVLDATRLSKSASFGTVTGSEVPGDNAYKLFLAMSGAAKYTDISGDKLGFQGRSLEKVKSTHYFVRVKNGDYNFSNNPTFVTGSEGDLSQPSFINDPKTYITTVGLYNNNKELVAVAKLSKAIQKSFTKEALIKVKLDFAWVAGLINLLQLLW